MATSGQPYVRGGAAVAAGYRRYRGALLRPCPFLRGKVSLYPPSSPSPLRPEDFSRSRVSSPRSNSPPSPPGCFQPAAGPEGKVQLCSTKVVPLGQLPRLCFLRLVTLAPRRRSSGARSRRPARMSKMVQQNWYRLLSERINC